MSKKYKISDHAIVRYLDRVMGFDVNTIHNLIINNGIIPKLESVSGTGTIPIEGGFAVFKNYTCVTIKSSAKNDYKGLFNKKIRPTNEP